MRALAIHCSKAGSNVSEQGGYDLEFPPDAPKRIIDGRRKWLEMYDQYLDMSNAGIETFPQTFQTFERHKKANKEIKPAPGATNTGGENRKYYQHYRQANKPVST